VGESAAVDAPTAIANAVVDALAHVGVRHVDIPITPEKVWRLPQGKRPGGVARKTSEGHQTFCRIVRSS
jgi:carbon-monoxide dehydrogenase large subunit